MNANRAWFQYGKERIGQGRENARAFLVGHPEIAEEIEKKIRDQWNTDRGAGMTVQASAEEVADGEATEPPEEA